VMACKQLRDYLDYGVVVNSVNFPKLGTRPEPTVRTRLAIVNRDVPGMIATISGILADRGVNIHNFANGSNGVIGYNLVDIEGEVGEEVIVHIARRQDIVRVRTLKFPQ